VPPAFATALASAIRPRLFAEILLDPGKPWTFGTDDADAFGVTKLRAVEMLNLSARQSAPVPELFKMAAHAGG
jgi:hypothetical protein